MLPGQGVAFFSFKPISDGLIAHEEDNNPDLNDQPLEGKQQPHMANLLASDG